MSIQGHMSRNPHAQRSDTLPRQSAPKMMRKRFEGLYLKWFPFGQDHLQTGSGHLYIVHAGQMLC